jgi:hypothetical protein
MARYSAFLGCKVEVLYRAGDILLPASGIFVADSGRSIFLEQHLKQHGQQRHFRWEIPYQYLVRLERAAQTEEIASPTVTAVATKVAERQAPEVPDAAADVSQVAPPILPLHNRAKIA